MKEQSQFSNFGKHRGPYRGRTRESNSINSWKSIELVISMIDFAKVDNVAHKNEHNSSAISDAKQVREISDPSPVSHYHKNLVVRGSS